MAKELSKKERADIDNLSDYTNTIAAIYLLEEAFDHGAMVSVAAANEIIKQENLKDQPTIGHVIKKILAEAGTPQQNSCKWKKQGDDKYHLDAVITLGGAVYNVDFIAEESTSSYTVKINTKLEQLPKRGKLFFNNKHEAIVKLRIDEHDKIHGITKNGLDINSTSFVPRPSSNEILAKLAKSMADGKKQRLAVMGTGSGKSIVMAGVAQAVGRTVMIVPDKSLVNQQAKEVKLMLSAGIIQGKKVPPPSIFTFEELKNNLDIDWTADPECKNQNNIDKVRHYFRDVLAGKEVKQKQSIKSYDQLILEAEHSLFKIIAKDIKESIVLLDESHQHTFEKENIEILSALNENNTVLALTATPTSELYQLYPGEPLDDISLGAAIELGTIRPIKPELTYLEEDALIDNAVSHYFNDYYLSKENNGYVDPGELMNELIDAKIKEGKIKKGEISSSTRLEVKKLAIEKALELNRIRAQRNMAFSDNEKTRSGLASIYQKIAAGDLETINKYKEKIALLRAEVEINARLDLEAVFTLPTSENTINLRQQIKKEMESTPRKIDLLNEINTEQKKDIQRTINSHALALIFGDKPESIAEKDRLHQLTSLLSRYEQEEEPRLIEKRRLCSTRTYDSIKESLLEMPSPIHKLPEDQKTLMIEFVCKKAEKIARHIHANVGSSLIDLINQPSIEDEQLNLLKTKELYCGVLDLKIKKNNPQLMDTQLAQMETGLRTHIVADQVAATGVSIKDVLNVQLINNYSEYIERDPGAINGPLSCAQAAGRCVRSADTMARVQQYIDKRYQDKKLILTIDDIVDPKFSAVKTKEVMLNRDQALLALQTERIHRTANNFQDLIHSKHQDSPIEKIFNTAATHVEHSAEEGMKKGINPKDIGKDIHEVVKKVIEKIKQMLPSLSSDRWVTLKKYAQKFCQFVARVWNEVVTYFKSKLQSATFFKRSQEKKDLMNANKEIKETVADVDHLLHQLEADKLNINHRS